MTDDHDQHGDGNFDYLYCDSCLKAAEEWWMTMFPAREILNEMAWRIHPHECDAETLKRTGRCYCMNDHDQSSATE